MISGIDLLELVRWSKVVDVEMAPAEEAKRIDDERQAKKLKNIQKNILSAADEYQDAWVPGAKVAKSQTVGFEDFTQTIGSKKNDFLKNLIEKIFLVFRELLKQKGLEAAFDNEEMIQKAIESVLEPLKQDKPAESESSERKEKSRKRLTAESLELIVGRLDQFILATINQSEAKPNDRVYVHVNASSADGDYVYFFDTMKPQVKENKKENKKEAKEEDIYNPTPTGDDKLTSLANLGLLPDNGIFSNQLINYFGKRVFDLLHDKARSNDDKDHLSYRKQISRYFEMSKKTFDPNKKKDMQTNWFAVQFIRALQPIDLLWNLSIEEFNGTHDNFENVLEEVTVNLGKLAQQEDFAANEEKDEHFKKIHANNQKAIQKQLEKIEELRKKFTEVRYKDKYFRNGVIKDWRHNAYTSLFRNYKRNQDIIGLKGQTICLPIVNVSNTFTLNNAEYSQQEHITPESESQRVTRGHLWLTANKGIQLDSRICQDDTHRKELLHGICFVETLANHDKGRLRLDEPYEIQEKELRAARRTYRTIQAKTKKASLQASQEAPNRFRQAWTNFKLFWNGIDENGVSEEALERRQLYDNTITRASGRAFRRIAGGNQPQSIYRVADIKDFNVDTTEGNAIVVVAPVSNLTESHVDIYYFKNNNPIFCKNIVLQPDELSQLAPNERNFVKQSNENQAAIRRIISETTDAIGSRPSIAPSPIRDALETFALTSREKEKVARSIYRVNKLSDVKIAELEDDAVVIVVPEIKDDELVPIRIFFVTKKEEKQEQQNENIFLECDEAMELSLQELTFLQTNENFFVAKTPQNQKIITDIRRKAAMGRYQETVSARVEQVTFDPSLAAAAVEFSSIPNFSHVPLPTPLKVIHSGDAFTATLEFVNQFFLFFDRDVMAQHPYLALAFFTLPYINIAFPILAASMSGSSGTGLVAKAVSGFGSALNTINHSLLTMEAGAAKYTGLNAALKTMHLPTVTVAHLKAATASVTNALTWATLAEEPLEKALVGCVMAKMLFNTAELLINNPMFAEHDASLLEQYITSILPAGALGTLKGSTPAQTALNTSMAVMMGGAKLLASAVGVGFLEQFLPVVGPIFNELATVPWKEITSPKFTGIEIIQTLAVAKSASFIIIKIMGIYNNIHKGELFDVDDKPLRPNSPSFDVLAKFMAIVHDDRERAFFMEKMEREPQKYAILRDQFEQLLAHNPSLWEEYRGRDGHYAALKELNVTRLVSKGRYKLPLALLEGVLFGFGKFLIGLLGGQLVAAAIIGISYLFDRPPPRNAAVKFIFECAELSMKPFKFTWTLMKAGLHSFLAVAIRIPEIVIAVACNAALLLLNVARWVDKGLSFVLKGFCNLVTEFICSKAGVDPSGYYLEHKEPLISEEHYKSASQAIRDAHVTMALWIRPVRHWIEDRLSDCLTACRNFFIRPLEREIQVQSAGPIEAERALKGVAGDPAVTAPTPTTVVSPSSIASSPSKASSGSISDTSSIETSTSTSKSPSVPYHKNRNLVFTPPSVAVELRDLAVTKKQMDSPFERVSRAMNGVKRD